MNSSAAQKSQMVLNDHLTPLVIKLIKNMYLLHDFTQKVFPYFFPLGVKKGR